MKYKVETTAFFDHLLKKLVKKHPSAKQEISSLVDKLKVSPELGIKLGAGVFKIRIQIPSKNKSKRDGALVITYVYYKAESVYLIHLYDKGEIEPLNTKYISELIKNLNL